MTLNGFPCSWDSFAQGICAQDKLPEFDKLWIDFVQVEARFLSINSLSRNQDEEIQALGRKGKGKGRRNSNKKDTGRTLAPIQDQKKKDPSKIKCFKCHTFGHYAS